MSLDEEPLSPIPEELFEKHKAPSGHVNLTDGSNNRLIVLSQNLLPFCFTTSTSVKMRNELLDHLITLLQGTEKTILTLNCYKPLSNTGLAALVTNATKNINSQLDIINADFQQHCRQD